MKTRQLEFTVKWCWSKPHVWAAGLFFNGGTPLEFGPHTDTYESLHIGLAVVNINVWLKTTATK